MTDLREDYNDLCERLKLAEECEQRERELRKEIEQVLEKERAAHDLTRKSLEHLGVKFQEIVSENKELKTAIFNNLVRQ